MRPDLMLFVPLLALAAPEQNPLPEFVARWEPAISMELTRTEHGDAMISVAELATEARVSKEARRLYERALKADRKGDAVRALEHARAALELDAAYFQAHAALAVAHLKAGDLDGADRQLNISVSLNPQYLPAREIRGLLLYFRGDLRQAVVVLEALLQQAPCRETGRRFLALALLKLGDAPRARYHLDMAEILARDKGRRGLGVPELGTGWVGASFQEDTLKRRGVLRPGAGH